MPIAWTTRLAFCSIQAELSGRRRQVYEAIRDWTGATGPTIESLARSTGLKESTICGRLNELRDLGAIENGPLVKNSTGKDAMTYRAVVYREPAGSEPRQLSLSFRGPSTFD